MLDTRKAIVAALEQVQDNVKYELDVQSPTLPLISYKCIDDSVNKYGDTLGYSDVIYQVKVWTTKMSELATLTQSIDDKLKAIGLHRTYFSELKEANVLIGVMQYTGLVKENFN